MQKEASLIKAERAAFACGHKHKYLHGIYTFNTSKFPTGACDLHGLGLLMSFDVFVFVLSYAAGLKSDQEIGMPLMCLWATSCLEVSSVHARSATGYDH